MESAFYNFLTQGFTVQQVIQLCERIRRSGIIFFRTCDKWQDEVI